MTFDLEQHLQDVRAALSVWPACGDLFGVLQAAESFAEELTVARTAIETTLRREGRQLEYLRALQTRIKAAEKLNEGLAERVAKQSEILSRSAERIPGVPNGTPE